MEWYTTLLRGFSKPFKWWLVVATWERGLRVRFGKNPKVLEPGLHFRIPYVDRVYVQSVRLRTLTDANINATTMDGRNIVVSVGIEFEIRDIAALYDSLSSPDQTIAARIAESIVRNVAHTASDKLAMGQLAEFATSSIDVKPWGLESFRVSIISFTRCRAYRLLMNDYRSGSGVNRLEDDEGK